MEAKVKDLHQYACIGTRLSSKVHNPDVCREMAVNVPACSLNKYASVLFKGEGV